MEVKGTVHAFLSSDNFHPKIKEINALLERFYKKMKEAGVEGPESSHMDIIFKPLLRFSWLLAHIYCFH